MCGTTYQQLPSDNLFNKLDQEITFLNIFYACVFNSETPIYLPTYA